MNALDQMALMSKLILDKAKDAERAAVEGASVKPLLAALSGEALQLSANINLALLKELTAPYDEDTTVKEVLERKLGAFNAYQRLLLETGALDVQAVENHGQEVMRTMKRLAQEALAEARQETDAHAA